MNDGQVIKALGGYKAVAPLLDVTEENALHMERRRIPWKYRAAVKAIARKKRVKLPDDFIENQRSV